MILRPSRLEELMKRRVENRAQYLEMEREYRGEMGSWHLTKGNYLPVRDPVWEEEEFRLEEAGELLPRYRRMDGVPFSAPPPDGRILNNIQLAKHLNWVEESPYEVVIPILPRKEKDRVVELFSPKLTKTALELLIERGVWLKRGEKWSEQFDLIWRSAYLRNVTVPLWKEALEEVTPFLPRWLRRRPGYLHFFYFHRQGRGYKLQRNPQLEALQMELPIELLLERGTLPPYPEKFLKYSPVAQLLPSLFLLGAGIEVGAVDEVPGLVERFREELERLPKEYSYLKPLGLTLYRDLKFFFPKERENRFIVYFRLAQFVGERGELRKGIEYLYRSLRRFAYTYIRVQFPKQLQKLFRLLIEGKEEDPSLIDLVGEILLEELFNHPPEGYPFAIHLRKVWSFEEYQQIVLHLKSKFRDPSRWGIEGRIFPQMLGIRLPSHALPKVIKILRERSSPIYHNHHTLLTGELELLFLFYREFIVDPFEELPPVDLNIPDRGKIV